jgi:hypothetical protein
MTNKFEFRESIYDRGGGGRKRRQAEWAFKNRTLKMKAEVKILKAP